MTVAELLGKVMKGLYSALVAFLGAMSAILVGNSSLMEITDGQWVTMSLAALIAFGGVFGLAGWTGPKINGPGTGGR